MTKTLTILSKMNRTAHLSDKPLTILPNAQTNKPVCNTPMYPVQNRHCAKTQSCAMSGNGTQTSDGHLTYRTTTTNGSCATVCSSSQTNIDSGARIPKARTSSYFPPTGDFKS